MSAPAPPRPPAPTLALPATVAVAALALAASALSLRNGFALDDVGLIQVNPTVQSLARPWRFFAESYWHPLLPQTLYRPVTKLGFALQWAAGGGAPWVFHAVSVALYVAVAVAVLRLARQLLPPVAAWAAAALFAVHPVHVEVSANVAGQAELLAALPLLAAVALHVGWRRAGPLAAPQVAALAGLYALACLAKEHGIVLPGLLAAAELTVLRGAPGDRRGLTRVAAALAPVAVAVVAARRAALGLFQGDYPAPALLRASVPDRWLTMLGVVPEWVRLLLWPAHLQADYSPQEIATATAVGPAQLAGVVALLALAAVLVVAWRRAPAVAFGLAWMAVAIAPVSNVFFAAGIVLAERTLFLPSVGAMVALAGAGQALLGGRPRLLRHPALGAGLLLAALALGVWRSNVRIPAWRDAAALFEATVRDAPRSYKAHAMYGQYLFDAGRPRDGEREYRAAIALYPDDGTVLAGLADRYAAAGLCAPAVPLYRRAADLMPSWAHPRERLAECLARLPAPGAR